MQYKVTIDFKTDYQLEQDEVDDLLAFISLQVEEPADWKGQQARYNTSDIEINIEP